MQRRMGTTECHQFILDYFHAHTIKGQLKPSRTYEVIERSSTKLKISTRNGNGRSVQTLFADLITCKSLKYGEFRRVDLFWGADRRDTEVSSRPRHSGYSTAGDDAIHSSIPGPAFLSNGEPMPVDTFLDRRVARLKRVQKDRAS